VIALDLFLSDLASFAVGLFIMTRKNCHETTSQLCLDIFFHPCYNHGCSFSLGRMARDLAADQRRVHSTNPEKMADHPRTDIHLDAEDDPSLGVAVVGVLSRVLRLGFAPNSLMRFDRSFKASCSGRTRSCRTFLPSSRLLIVAWDHDSPVHIEAEISCLEWWSVEIQQS
jgi:hypothetical protein